MSGKIHADVCIKLLKCATAVAVITTTDDACLFDGMPHIAPGAVSGSTESHVTDRVTSVFTTAVWTCHQVDWLHSMMHTHTLNSTVINSLTMISFSRNHSAFNIQIRMSHAGTNQQQCWPTWHPISGICRLAMASVLSHARTVVRECCKGDDESQWERGKFDPPPPKNPLTDGHQNLCK